MEFLNPLIRLVTKIRANVFEPFETFREKERECIYF